MPLDEPHPIWPEGPDCDEQCPGKWSQYHDGFAWGYEKAVAEERARIRAAVEGLAMGPGTLGTDGTTTSYTGDVWAYRAAALAIIDRETP